MATVIEEALIAIKPDFGRFREELSAGLAEATKGMAVTVKVDADVTAAKAKVDSIKDKTTTVKVEADVTQAKADVDSIKAKTVTVKAKADTAEAEAGLKRLATVARGIQAMPAGVQKTQINQQVTWAKQAADEYAKAWNAAHTENAQRAGQAFDAIKGRIAQQVAWAKQAAEEYDRDWTAAHAENAKRAKEAADKVIADQKRAAMAAKQQADDAAAAAKKQGRAIAEALNVLPGIGGVGPHAARIIAGGIIGGAPLIGQAITSAVSGGVGAAGLATGLLISAKDPRVIQAGHALAISLGNTLGGAAEPFTENLLRVMPAIGTHLAKLQPQLEGLFTPIARTLPNIEQGLLGALKGALPGMQTAAQNAAQFINALVSKAPDVGRAFGQFISEVSSPAPVEFIKKLIDFVDQLVVSVGKVVKAFADLSGTPLFQGVAAAVVSVVKEVNLLVDGLAAIGGSGLVAGIVAAGTAIVLFGHKAKAAWDESTAAAQRYQATVAEGGLGMSRPAAYGKALFGTIPAAGGAAAAEGEAAAGGAAAAATRAGALRRLAGPALGVGALIAGGFAGDALTSAGHPILGGVASGALTGAGLGFMAGGPWGAAIGAGAGAAIGGISAQWQQHNQNLEQAKTDLAGVADQYAKTGSVMANVGTIMASNNEIMKSLVTNGSKFGAGLPDVAKAMNAGDTGAIEAARDRAQKDMEQATKGKHWWDAALPGTPKEDWQKRAESDQSTIDAYNQALAYAREKQAEKFAVDPNRSQNDISSMFSDFQKMIAPTQQMQVINTVIDTYNNWKMAIRGVQDAEYEQAQTAQQTAMANAEALHGIATAEHQVAQAQFATTQAQQALTQARKDAIQNLKDLSRQVRDIGDNEEELKIRLVQAQLTEVQTRGLPSESLVRRQAVVGLDEAKNALADFQADEPTLRDKYALAKKQGVEGAPNVVSAKNALEEAQYSQKEALRDLKLAHDNYNITLQASKRANDLAARAVGDANTALGQQNLMMAAVEKATGLATGKIQDLHDHLDKLTQKPFTLTLTDGNSAAQVGGKLQGVYGDMAQLAQQFGITLPNWTSTYDSSVPNAVAPVPKTVSPGQNFVGMDPYGQGGVWFGGKHFGPYADGGPVRGWSPHDRADNIPAWLTANEFVVNAKSTRKHRSLLEAINSDRGYADGGFVLPFGTLANKWTAPIEANIKALGGTSSGGGTPGATSAGGQSIAAVQDWLKSTVDPLNYVFGATGPSAYDCSGLVGEVWARLTGNPDYKRYFVTGTERAFLKAHGWQDGPGTFTVGFSGGHTMGNLAGLNFEAANSRDGILIGNGTSNVLSFPNVMHLPQLGDKFLSVGTPANVPDPSKVTVGGLYGTILRKILTEAKQAATGAGVAGGDPGLVRGGPVARWRDTVVQALRDNGMSTSNDFVDAVLRQINTESSGNPNAIQQVHDVNWPNNRARGLMQTTPTTFGEYAFPGHSNIFNGYDNLLAALNYVKHRYHGDVLGVLGHGHGYDSGGWLKDVGFNFTGQPEAVLTPQESKAYVKHAEAISGTGEMRLDDWTINRLAQVLSTRPIPVHVDGRKVADAVIPHLERRF